jgi:nucleoside-diphosphate-sugar epimerase
MGRYLVTGGAGYLGSALSRLLLRHGHEVLCADQRRPPAGVRPATLGALRFLDADLGALPWPRAAFHRVDAVVHLGGLSSDGACNRDPELADRLNRVATERLARQAAAEGVRRFVLASSCAVYGRGVELDESARVRPTTVYARSKADAEECLRNAADTDLEPVVLRQATLFGVAPSMRFDLVLNAMTRDAVSGGVVRVRDGGRQWRPLLHVADAAAVLLWAAEAPQAEVAGQVFNVARPGANLRVREIAELVAGRVRGTVLALDGEPTESAGGYAVRADRLAQVFGQDWGRPVEDGVDEVRALVTKQIDSAAQRPPRPGVAG